MTATQIITAAMRMNGVLGHGQTPSPEDLDAGFSALNALIDSWRTEHRKVFVIDHKEFPLTSGIGHYTMGPGGTFDTERPVKIQSAGLVYYKTADGTNLVEGLRRPLNMINQADYDLLPEKTVAGHEPVKLLNNNAYPLTELFLWPIPLCP